MYKAYKFRIYPNDEQKTFINKTFGCSRYVYNYYGAMITFRTRNFGQLASNNV